MPQHMVRKQIYRVRQVLPHAEPFLDNRKGDPATFVDFDGDLMKMASDRYKCFIVSGISCVSCGVRGLFFAKERDIHAKTYHFNLYAVTDEGEEILMTKDHIKPVSAGGKDHVSNYQTMCSPCNEAKGCTYNEEENK